MTPRVTILLPVRAPEPAFFEAAVQSIVAQTFADWCLLVVEAGNAQETTEILRTFGDDRIRHITMANSSNLTEQLNYGLGATSSEIIVRMDADDLCQPGRITRQVAFLDENPDVDVVGSWLEGIDEHGKSLGLRRYPATHAEISRTLPLYNCLGHPSVAFRRTSVLNAGGYDLPGRPAQDYELWCRMAAKGYRFANLAEPLLRYRLHSQSAKATRLVETIRSTLETKRKYWRPGMPLRVRLRYWGELGLLTLPAKWTHACFSLLTYRH